MMKVIEERDKRIFLEDAEEAGKMKTSNTTNLYCLSDIISVVYGVT